MQGDAHSTKYSLSLERLGRQVYFKWLLSIRQNGDLASKLDWGRLYSSSGLVFWRLVVLRGHLVICKKKIKSFNKTYNAASSLVSFSPQSPVLLLKRYLDSGTELSTSSASKKSVFCLGWTFPGLKSRQQSFPWGEFMFKGQLFSCSWVLRSLWNKLVLHSVWDSNKRIS